MLRKNNNYKKLLRYLDNGQKPNNTPIIGPNNTITEVIRNINQEYTKNGISNEHFTGWNHIDVIMNELCEENNPNYYISNITGKPYKYKKTNTKKDKEEEEKEKEKIIISEDIRSIQDLIKITELYDETLDDEREYNINMSILRKIKEPLAKMDTMIGMHKLKQNVLDQILFYLQNLHNNTDFMHTVIYGSPGTGKTEIAKIIGNIFTNLGILTKGTFTKVTRSDLIAGYLGQTAIKTKEVIKESLGGVLFIDEAYALGNSEKKDSFSKECIDTLCEAASDHKDNLMIIIAGYEQELNDCFFNYNPGLGSRFNWRFKTDIYTSEDLYHIFLKKVTDAGWSVSPVCNINKEWFERHKDSFSFYGRDIETLLSKIKIAHARRIFGKPENERKIITLDDIKKGLAMFMDNDEAKRRKEQASIKKSMSNMYI